MSESKPVRVVVVDDHAVVRSGLVTFLGAFPDMELVGEASDGEEAVELCATVQPDVVLMDLIMPGMGGAAATRAIRQRCPDAKVIALTSFGEDEMVRSALQSGAIGYLLKNVSHVQLAEAIRQAHRGQPALGPEATLALMRSAGGPPAPGSDLTPREREVLALIVEGLSNLEIAERLVITESTAKGHVSSIISKLGKSNRAGTVALALRHHLSD